jgi:hypothetical protein
LARVTAGGDHELTNCSKAKQRTILANSVRFAQRCRELLAIEYGRNPRVLESMSRPLQDEIATASARQNSTAKLIVMRLRPSSTQRFGRWSRIVSFFRGLIQVVWLT